MVQPRVALFIPQFTQMYCPNLGEQDKVSVHIVFENCCSEAVGNELLSRGRHFSTSTGCADLSCTQQSSLTSHFPLTLGIQVSAGILVSN